MALTSITNVSNQVVPILIGTIPYDKAITGSDIPAAASQQLQLQPGSEVEVESNRLDLAQLESIQNKKLIRFVAR